MSINIYFLSICYRPLRDDEKLPVRTHRVVLDKNSDEIMNEDDKPKKKHRKDKEEKRKHRKEGKEKVF